MRPPSRTLTRFDVGLSGVAFRFSSERGWFVPSQLKRAVKHTALKTLFFQDMVVLFMVNVDAIPEFLRIFPGWLATKVRTYQKRLCCKFFRDLRLDRDSGLGQDPQKVCRLSMSRPKSNRPSQRSPVEQRAEPWLFHRLRRPGISRRFDSIPDREFQVRAGTHHRPRKNPKSNDSHHQPSRC